MASINPGGSETPVSGWYDAGSTVAIKETNNSGWASGGWIGTGIGSYSGNDSLVSITLNSSINESALFSLVPYLCHQIRFPYYPFSFDG